ncbi:MAG: hypothetical protein AB7E55_14290 [Pigmentiphaga sp.]
MPRPRLWSPWHHSALWAGMPIRGCQSGAPEVNLKAAYHLDQPLLTQYVLYLGNLARGDLGPSFKYRDRSVNDLIATGFPVSLRLGAWAMAVALLAGVPLGIWAALRRNRATDHAVMGVALAGIAVPEKSAPSPYEMKANRRDRFKKLDRVGNEHKLQKMLLHISTT